MSVCLDAFAMLAWILDERSADETEALLSRAHANKGFRCFLSVLNLGEVYYRLVRLGLPDRAESLWAECRAGSLPVSVVEATVSRVRAAAEIKGRFALSYCDAFAVSTAIEHAVPLATGDPEIIAVKGSLGIRIHELRR